MHEGKDSNGEHVININELLDISVTREHDSGWSRCINVEDGTGKPIIDRINRHIRDKPGNVFLPYILSIGPYNYCAPATRSMQKTKFEFLNHVLNLKHDKGLPDFLEAMKKLEKKIKGCYADAITMDKNDFLKMLLLDGCFIFICLRGLEAFMPAKMQALCDSNGETEVAMNMIMNDERGITNEGKTHEAINDQTAQSNVQRQREADEEYSSPSDFLYSEYCRHDLLLLENQIPFFVIETIHEVIAVGSSTTSKLVENVVELVESALDCYPKAISKSNMPNSFHHLLHLCHLYFKPCSHLLRSKFLDSINQRSIDEALPWHRAAEYRQAGIDFKKRAYSIENPHSLLDLIFCNGVIEIPCLTVQPNMYSLFCNLVAFKQNCPQFGSFVTTYVIFLSRLISTPEDVSILTERGIIVHQLNSDAEVSDIFKGISECIVYDFDNDSYLKSLCLRLEEQYQRHRPILRELIGSITSKFRGWTQKNELSDLPVSMTTGASV